MASHLDFARASRWDSDSLASQTSVVPWRYPRFPRLVLPAAPDGAPAPRHSRREFGAGELALTDLSAILAPLTARDGSRAYASAGAIYAVETFVLARRVGELERDVVHHVLPSAMLEVLWPAPELPARAFPNQTWVHAACAVLAVAANVTPYVDRYGERGYRFALLEAGAVAQLLEAAAATRGLAACQAGGFVDHELAAALGCDLDRGEQPLTCVAVGPE